MELILLILLLVFSTANDLQLSDCSVSAEVGETAILPVKVDLTEDSEQSGPLIFWKNEKGGIVHQYSYIEDFNEHQIKHFKNRTSLFSKEEITKGNFSLKIRDVTKNDTGKYTCEVHIEDDKRYNVSLCVLEISERTGSTKSPEPKSPGLTTGQTAGVVIVVLALAAALIVGAVFLYKRRKGLNNDGNESDQEDEENNPFSGGGGGVDEV